MQFTNECWKSWENYTIKKIYSSNQIKDPFPHYYINNIFHPELYSKLVEYWPNKKYFDKQSEALGVEKCGTPNADLREVLLTQDSYLVAENNIQKDFWYNFDSFINGKKFVEALFYRNRRTIKNMRKDLKQGFLTLTPHTSLDYSLDGFGVPPHLDSNLYLMTCVFYTPDNYNKKTLGTTVLSPKESLKSLRKDIGYEFNGEYFKEEQFNLIRKYEFVPNSVFILLVGPNSYHSLPIIKNGNLDRKTISLNLYQEFKSSFISLRDRKKEFKSEKKYTFPSYKKFSLKRFKYL